MSFSYHVFLTFFYMVKELECERECSRGEDYRLIKLTIIDYNVGAVRFFFMTYIFLLVSSMIIRKYKILSLGTITNYFHLFWRLSFRLPIV